VIRKIYSDKYCRGGVSSGQFVFVFTSLGVDVHCMRVMRYDKLIKLNLTVGVYVFIVLCVHWCTVYVEFEK
jgi:hypothetical protein